MNDMILKAFGINPQDIKEYADKLALAMKYAQEKAETIERQNDEIMKNQLEIIRLLRENAGSENAVSENV